MKKKHATRWIALLLAVLTVLTTFSFSVFATSEGGETEEVYFKLHELGCDGFSTDYPSVMFSVIRKLKERK